MVEKTDAKKKTGAKKNNKRDLEIEITKKPVRKSESKTTKIEAEDSLDEEIEEMMKEKIVKKPVKKNISKTKEIEFEAEDSLDEEIEEMIKEKIVKKSNDTSTIARKKEKRPKIPEEWKPFPINILNEKYEISNMGKIRYIDTEKEVTTQKKNKYKYFSLSPADRNKDLKATYRVHRLVALAFVDNPDPKKYNLVNHKNGIKDDNDFRNLEWTNASGNNLHAYKEGLIVPFKRPVKAFADGELIGQFDTINAAQNATGVPNNRISELCKGTNVGRKNYYTSNGKNYTFEYVDKDTNIPDDEIFDPAAQGFKQLKKYPKYWVSKEGQIYSTGIKRFMRTYPHSGTGVYQVQLSCQGKTKTIFIHNIVAKYFLPKPKEDPKRPWNCVTHKNGNNQDNRVENLKWNHITRINTDFNF